MNNHSYEIEIKSLLGSKENASILLAKMKEKEPKLVEVGSHKQLNHYFIDGDLEKFYQTLLPYITEEKKELFREVTSKAEKYSIRTRLADADLILVIKGSLGNDSSANGVIRMEFESIIRSLTLDQLDQLILGCGFTYQAKWSRERQAYKYRGLDVTIDKNAGYGYLAEFEKQITDAALADEAKAQIIEIMNELGAAELPQDRLERMFNFYNHNWADYYGTDKIFTIE